MKTFKTFITEAADASFDHFHKHFSAYKKALNKAGDDNLEKDERYDAEDKAAEHHEELVKYHPKVASDAFHDHVGNNWDDHGKEGSRKAFNHLKTLNEELVTEAVVDWRTAHNEIQATGHRNDNAGGGYTQTGSVNSHHYVKSHNINGDDHRYGIRVNYKDAKPKFVATHSVSHQYWGNRWDNPDMHRAVETKEFRSHKRAIAHLDTLFKRNAKKKAK